MSPEIVLGIAHMRDADQILCLMELVPSIDGVAYAVMRQYSNNLNPLRLLVGVTFGHGL